MGPPTRVRTGFGGIAWLVTRHAEAVAVLSDQRFSVELTGDDQTIAGARLALSFLTMDDPRHMVLRRALAAEFTIRRVTAMRPWVEQIADALLDDIERAGPPADLVADFALPLPSLVICRLLGVPYERHEFFQRSSQVIVDPGSTMEQVGTAMGELTGYLAELLAAKDAEPADDLLSRLVTDYVRPGTISLDEAANMSRFLLTAGHETTANMISLGALLLLCHPDQLAELRATDDPEVVQSAVNEMLRYLSVLTQGVVRTAREDLRIGDTLIRAGEAVVVPFNAANRDPAAFAGDPDQFDIHRDARRHLAFGFGAHHCLGRPLALLELEVVFPRLLRRLPGLALATDLESVAGKNEASIYGLRTLPVTW
nr:cytochrome P450 [Kibdelosporangium sp. MJ126-NF4]